MAMGYEFTPGISPDQLSKEQTEQSLAALVRERNGYEQRLAAAKSKDTVDKAEIGKLESRVAAVNEQLGLLGETSEPRNKIRK